MHRGSPDVALSYQQHLKVICKNNSWWIWREPARWGTYLSKWELNTKLGTGLADKFWFVSSKGWSRTNLKGLIVCRILYHCKFMYFMRKREERAKYWPSQIRGPCLWSLGDADAKDLLIFHSAVTVLVPGGRPHLTRHHSHSPDYCSSPRRSPSPLPPQLSRPDPSERVSGGLPSLLLGNPRTALTHSPPSLRPDVLFYP